MVDGRGKRPIKTSKHSQITQNVLVVLKSRLESKGFHGFVVEPKSNVVHFFGTDGMKNNYQVAAVGSGYELRRNVEPLGLFDDGDDVADFILI